MSILRRFNRATLKSWFERGDTPTEQQFSDFIDSIPNFIEDKPVLTINNTAPDESGNFNFMPESVNIETDAEPTAESVNPVQSGGVYAALEEKLNADAVTSVIALGETGPAQAEAVAKELEKKAGVNPETNQLDPAIIPDKDYTGYQQAGSLEENDTFLIQTAAGGVKRFAFISTLLGLFRDVLNSFAQKDEEHDQKLSDLQDQVNGLGGGTNPIAGFRWVTPPQIETEGSDIVLLNNAGADWPSGYQEYTAGVISASPLPAEPDKRIDILAIYPDGSLTLEKGTAAPVAPTEPPVPAGAVKAGFVLWTSAGGSVNQAEIDQIKADIRALQAGSGSGGGSVDSVNLIAPDAGTKNITLAAKDINYTATDTTWWGVATQKINAAFNTIASRLKTVQANFDNLPLDNVWIGDASGKRSITKTANIYIQDTALIAALRNSANWAGNMYQAGLGMGFKGQEFTSQSDLYVYKCVQDGVWCRYPNNASSLDIFNADGDASLAALNDPLNWTNGSFTGVISGLVKAGTFTIGAGYVFLFVSNNVPIRLKRE